jgi:hypothetical protein
MSIGSEVLRDEFVTRWIGTVREQLPEMQVSNLLPGVGKKEYLVDLTDSGGSGSVQLTVGRSSISTTPQQAADDMLWVTGDCEPPYRTVLADGTIIQLHSVRAADPFQSLAQEMVVYRPDRLILQLSMHNYGSKDMRANPQARSWERIGPGRPTLPLTEEQFSRLGPAIAGVA